MHSRLVMTSASKRTGTTGPVTPISLSVLISAAFSVLVFYSFLLTIFFAENNLDIEYFCYIKRENFTKDVVMRTFSSL